VVGAAFSARNVSQNWTIVSMFAEGRYSVDFDAAWLGNGAPARLRSRDSWTCGRRAGLPAGAVDARRELPVHWNNATP